jgi:hypothetical protein
MLVSGLRAVVEDDETTRACTDAHAVALWLAREAEQDRGAPFPPEALAAAVETDLFDPDSLSALKAAHPPLNTFSTKSARLTEQFAVNPEEACQGRLKSRPVAPVEK